LLTQLTNDLGYKVYHDGQTHTYNEHFPASDPPHRGMLNPRTVSVVTEQLEKQVYEQAIQGKLVLTLGGDHSIAIGTIAGTARAIKERLGREMAVIWVDAHADINTPESSESGHVHGMPVAFLTGIAKESEPSIFGWLNKDSNTNSGFVGTDRHGGRIVNGGEGTNSAEGLLSVKKLVYIGLRDVDRGEKEILRKYGVKAFSMHDIDK
jgi:arginase